MPLADTAVLAERAAQRQVGVGAFNIVHLEQAEIYVASAEAVGKPIILQISENAVRYHEKLGGTGLAPLATAALELAQRSTIPVGVHLDHAVNRALVEEAIELGIRSVMFDASVLPPEENEAATRGIANYCHLRGVRIEAELGEVGGKNGVHDPSARTSPADAAAFVAATGVDLLAVAVGSSHAMTSRGAVLDVELISEIRDQVPVPLVLHGSSGVSDEGMQAAIAAGMTKINVATHLNRIFTEGVRNYLVAEPDLVDTRKWFRVGLEAAGEEVARLLRLYG